MRKKRITVLLMAVMLLGVIAMHAVAISPAVPAEQPDRPTVEVVGNTVTDDEGYYELSLRVRAVSFQSVGVVLKYNADVLKPAASWEKDSAEMDLSTHTSWGDPAVVYTKGVDELPGKPALTYLDNKTGYLYLGADALAYMKLNDGADGGERVVTARFKLLVTGVDVKLPAAGDPAGTKYGVELAPEDSDAVKRSIPGTSLLTSTGPKAAGMGPDFYKYGHKLSESDPAGYNVTFVSVKEKSVNKGGEAVSGDYAITFFDWDGRVIDAIAAPKNATGSVAAWQGYSAIDARLTNKRGYAFDKWLVVYEDEAGGGLKTKNGTFTSNNVKLPANNKDVVDLTDLSQYTTKEVDSTTKTKTKSVLLQASYYARTTPEFNDTNLINNNNASGTSLALSEPDAQYVLVEQTYYQYGKTDGTNTGQYSVKCKVKRQSALRAQQPVVMFYVYVSATQFVTVRADLTNTDVTEFEVVVPRYIQRVAYQVLDVSGQSNWLVSPSRSAETRTDMTDIIKAGARGLIADELARGVYPGNADNQCLKDAGNITAAQITALNNATAAKPANTGVMDRSKWKPLTADEFSAIVP